MFRYAKKNKQSFSLNFRTQIDSWNLFRCEFVQKIYDEILETKDDEQSKVSLQAIDNVTKLLTNFAKYGLVS